MKLKSLFSAAAITTSLLLAGTANAADNTINVGVIAGAEAQVAEVAAKVAKEKYNLDVKLTIFSDYVIPNAALDDGSIDANAFQHLPYLDQQIKDRGYKIKPVGNTFVYPIAAYSKKIKSLDELKKGDSIAIPNDPTNEGRALLLLQAQGLIKLSKESGLQATPLDVIDNPKKLDFVELEAPQLPNSLQDVALAIINTTYASSINLSPEKDGIFVENKESPYTNLIVAREDNADSENVKNFVKAYQTEEVYEAAKKLFNGGVVKGW
ncbi:methionine ABC transporter substrate-binding lipoprotein MetQ [Vibrio rumoiensis]|uniref:Lipoprotein n=1 Tax=Vibrio rumoiensis 1S-45 TaxID=1188252 RepID=A0A1E5E0T6_9VIBR|nr:methionine ABC transporter substrate-binding lipoprotein MetQ [Vibrio rumoiensis]OEF23898.1 DL-methionine transporter substrate-binding subunit [Vibrio rumoiensis 1S-45]